jgi:hypothetical protein
LADSTVAYGELAVGKGNTLIAQALALPELQSNQQRASVGLSFTTGFNLNVSVEAEYSSAGPDADQWNALPIAAQQQVLSTAQSLQDLPSRSQVFLHAVWKDLFVRRFDLSGFVRQDVQTNSQALWLEGRQSWERAEVALQWQVYTGSAGSLFDAVPQQQTIQLVLRVYL